MAELDAADAYCMGGDARTAGQPKTTNPFADAERSRAWLMGWADVALTRPPVVMARAVRAELPAA